MMQKNQEGNLTVSISDPEIYYDNLNGIQTAFEWGGWLLLAGHWDCQTNQVSGSTPTHPGGPVSGTGWNLRVRGSANSMSI